MGGFGIFMSNMSQVQTILSFQGCDKIVLRLHTAGTENPDTPKHIRAPLISMNTIQIPPDTHQTPPIHPQTPSRHLQGAGNVNRRQQTPTDTARCTQTALVSVFGCLGLSVCVWWRLLLSVGISCSLEMSVGCLGDVW